MHVWASNFDLATDGPAQWFVRQPDITPAGGKFTLAIKPGYVYSLTTTTGQGKGTATGPPPADLTLPYNNDLSTGRNGEPTCWPPRTAPTSSLPATPPTAAPPAPSKPPPPSPSCGARTSGRHPYAIIGSDWASYTVSVDAMIPRPGSAGLLGRYHAVSASHGTFNAYLFTVSTDGTYTLTINHGGTAAYTTSGQRQLTPPHRTVLARGPAAFTPGTWHRLSLAVSGTTVTASLDGQPSRRSPTQPSPGAYPASPPAAGTPPTTPTSPSPAPQHEPGFDGTSLSARRKASPGQPHSSLGLGFWRRSTAACWRNTNSPASSGADERASSTI